MIFWPRPRCKAVWVLVLVPLFVGCRSFRDREIGQLADTFMGQGRVYLEQGLTDSALAAFGLALEANPKLVEAHMNMGQIYQDRGDYDLASRAYERAVNLAPNHFDARYAYGWMQHLMGNLKEAIDSYLQALLLRPESYEANLNIAAAYLQLGRPGDALPYAMKATELKAADQMAWSNLATAYSQLGWYEDAIGAYHEAMELGEPAEPIYMGLAQAHIRLGRYQQAIVVLETLNKYSPSTAAYQMIGFTHFKMHQFEIAMASYRTALTLEPNDPESLNGVGVCLMATYLQAERKDPGQRDEALKTWRHSLQLKPDQPHIVDLLSRYQRL